MSEDIHTLEEHFDGKAAVVRELYERIMELLGSFGQVTAEPKKTCIHLVRRTAIGGITVRKDFVILEFKTDYSIDSPLLAKTEQISRSRFHHTIKVTSPEVLTDQVKCWLRDAYELSA